MAQDFFATTFATLLTASLSIWFIAWAIRRNLEVDKPLDTSAKYVRFIVVIASYGIAAMPYVRPGSKLAVFQVLMAAVGLAFLCWPNFAYYLTQPFRRDHGHQSRPS
jgi:hypothetical protein